MITKQKHKAWLAALGGLLSAVLYAQPSVLLLIFNLATSLIAILCGSVGLLIACLLVKDPKQDPHSDEDVNSDSLLDRVTSSGLLQRIRTLWLYKKLSRSLNTLQEKLSQSETVHVLTTTPETSGGSINISQFIDKYGQMPRIPAAEYDFGPKHGSPANICLSQGMDFLMNQIIEFVYRDFIEYWYSQFCYDREVFKQMIKSSCWKMLKQFRVRFDQVDSVNLIINRPLKCIRKHFEELRLTARQGPEDDDKPPFRLHPGAVDDVSEQAFARHITAYILALSLPPESADVTSLRIILREVLAGSALIPFVDSICDPDYINRTLLAFLHSRGEGKTPNSEDSINTFAYAATYEDLIKKIRVCNSVQELERIRYRISTEIIHAKTISSLKKDNSKNAKARSSNKGELLMSRNLKRYLNQCLYAKQQCEKKIREISGYRVDIAASSPSQGSAPPVEKLHSFEDIMNISKYQDFFMTYLVKIGKGSLLKFWNQIEFVQANQLSGKLLAKAVTTAYQDHVLPSSPEPLLGISIERSCLEGMVECLMGNKSPVDFFHTQKNVYEVLLKDHYPSFLVSDVYTKQLAAAQQQQDVEPDGEERQASPGYDWKNDQLTNDPQNKLKIINEKLEFKAQVLESLMPATRLDPKVTEQLANEIHRLQHAKWQEQLHIDRTNAWWDHIGKWAAVIEHVAPPPEGSAFPIYTVVLKCSDIADADQDDSTTWIVERSLKEFNALFDALKDSSPLQWLVPKPPVIKIRRQYEKFMSESKVVLNQILLDILKDDKLRSSQNVFKFLHPGVSNQYEEHNVDYNTTQQQPQVDKIANNFKKFMKIPKDVIDKVSNQLVDEETSVEDDEASSGKDSIATPLYELIGEIFEIKGFFKFVRKFMMTFVQVAFGRNINRQLRYTCDLLCSETMVMSYMKAILDTVWPHGKLASSEAPVRTEQEKMRTKLEAKVMLLHGLPDVVLATLGQDNTRKGILKVFHCLQDKRLNKHLFYTLLCEFMEEIFPEVVKEELKTSSSTLST